jgi:hypothetical protein
MLKKVLIVLGVVLLIGILAAAYMNYRNRSLSPPDEQRITTASGMTVSINYSRPSVRDRLIFGTEEQEALQPYGVYWRLGANEATVLQVDRDFQMGGQQLKAGTYNVYAVPGADSFLIALNTEWDRWGYSEPEHANDLLSFNVPVEQHEHVEQFTIQLGETREGVRVICAWDDVRFVIPITEVR